MTLKSTILSLLLRYPTMPLKEITIRAPASYSYVWEVAQSNGLLREKDRAAAASIAAPHLVAQSEHLGEETEEIWSYAHLPSDAPTPHKVAVTSPSFSTLLSRTINCVSTDHGLYYRVPATSTHISHDRQGTCIIEIYDPNGPKALASEFKTGTLSHSASFNSDSLRWVSSENSYPPSYNNLVFEKFKDTKHDDESLNIDNTLFYSEPQTWEGFTVGDLRRCLDKCVTSCLRSRVGRPVHKRTYLKNPPTHDMVLIEEQGNGSSRVVTTDCVFMRWDSSGVFPFLPNKGKVVANYYDLRDMLNVYYSLYAKEKWGKVENEPVMISHGSPASGLRVSVGQVSLRSLEPFQAHLFPFYADVIPKVADTVPYAKIHKASLVSALREAAFSHLDNTMFLMRLDTALVDINDSPLDWDKRLGEAPNLNNRFRVLSYGTNPPRAIGIPYGGGRVQQLVSIINSIPTDNIIISGRKDRSSPNHENDVIIISEDNKVPDISDPNSSGVAFRSVLRQKLK